MDSELVNIFYMFYGMVLGAIGALGILWILEPKKDKELFKHKRGSEAEISHSTVKKSGVV